MVVRQGNTVGVVLLVCNMLFNYISSKQEQEHKN